MLFREYQPSDFEALYALDEECFVLPFRFSREMLKQSLEATNAHTLIAQEQALLVAFCVVHVERVKAGLIGYVVTLDVADAYRRQGFAAELMRRTEEFALHQSCVAVVLHVFTGNEGAIRFYERQGYERRRLAKGFYGDDARGASVDAWIYRKMLKRDEGSST